MNLSTPTKEEVRNFWSADPCGSRYLENEDDFNAHSQARYSLEPYIFNFARFESARGLKVLEIGVGMGADYLEWLKAGACAAGVDLSPESIGRARHRCLLAGYEPDLRIADAEQLPFPDNSFDVVYSYGVMHHSPNTPLCVQEAYRVLKPGGVAKVMIYHHPSVTGAMLWLRFGLLRGKSMRQSVFEHLESPGTKTYTITEARAMFEGFRDVHMQLVFSPGDLLLHRPSARFQSRLYRVGWRLFPRWLVRKFGGRWGLYLLVAGTKEASSS